MYEVWLKYHISYYSERWTYFLIPEVHRSDMFRKYIDVWNFPSLPIIIKMVQVAEIESLKRIFSCIVFYIRVVGKCLKRDHQEDAFESVVCEMGAIFSRPQCVKSIDDWYQGHLP